jgi:hypothetical protein
MRSEIFIALFSLVSISTVTSQSIAPALYQDLSYRNIGPFRAGRTVGAVGVPAQPNVFYIGVNNGGVWKTDDYGRTWKPIFDEAPTGSVGDIAVSPSQPEVIYVGTGEGLHRPDLSVGDGIFKSVDGGKTWKNVTPPELRAWDKVAQIDAGHFDSQTAYLAINAMRRDDMRPQIFRTHDAGASWTRIVGGLPEMGPVNVVREDSQQKGLLFAGTERAVYFSADDGEHWQSLRMNMPASSIRDLVIHEDDLVIGTHGRSIWILDNIAPLREMGKAAPVTAYLFVPPQATRARWNMFSDTPLPPEEPAGQNPPDGAILDYYLNGSVKEVRLEIVNRVGEVVRRFTSSDTPEVIDTTAIPHTTYWIRPQQRLSIAPGHHRFIWDLRYEPPPGSVREFAIASVYRNTPSAPAGPFVHPGRYTVRLTVDGVAQERNLDVRLDPRVSISEAHLQLQTDNALACYNAYLRLRSIRESIDALLRDSTAANKNAKREEQLQALRGSGEPRSPDLLYGSIVVVSNDRETIVGLQSKFLYLLHVLESAEARPTQQVIASVLALQETSAALTKKWEALREL